MTKGRPPRSRTPQEKKALSLTKDRRNAYGGNDKAARKAIPLRKALERRAARHLAASEVRRLPMVGDEEADQLGSPAQSRRRRRAHWIKSPDVPLADWINGQRAAAVRRVDRKKRSRLKPPSCAGPDD